MEGHFTPTVSFKANPAVAGLNMHAFRILPITPFKLKLETNWLQFYNVHVKGYKKTLLSW